MMACIVLGVAAAVLTSDLRVLALPFGMIVLFMAITDYRKLYLLLWASIPLSTEVEFGSIGADLPDEALMLMLMGIAFVLFITKAPRLSMRMFFNPITILLLLHFGWIALTAVTSTQPLISFKFLAAKMWYIAVFYFLTYYLIRKEADLTEWLKWLLIPILATVAWVWVRHAPTGFSFMDVNEFMKPVYRNHVDYALMLGVVLPFAWVFRDMWKGKYTGMVICAIMAIAIYFAYTRAAYLGILTGIAGYLIIRLGLVKYALILAAVVVGVLIAQLASDNRYIDYAPDYHKTITHYEFDNLLEATYKLEDISSMERVYRWIAGFYMIQERPVTGFGPGAFYESYMPYTDKHFVTYVSDNPERSGIHNYFLMTAADQGLPGLIIFVALLVAFMLKAQWLLRRLKDAFPRKLLIGCINTFFFIMFILLLNDMIETDKVGTFFFFCLAMIVAIEERFLPRENPYSGKTIEVKG